jgi:hypothetical protein
MEVVVIYFKELHQHLSARTEDNHQSQHLVSGPEYPIRNPLLSKHEPKPFIRSVGVFEILVIIFISK